MGHHKQYHHIGDHLQYWGIFVFSMVIINIYLDLLNVSGKKREILLEITESLIPDSGFVLVVM